jgi:hypothetical protein
MNNRIFVFKTKELNGNGQPYLLAIPENQIERIDSAYGSHNVFCKVNGIAVDCSFDDLVKKFGNLIGVVKMYSS